VLSSPSIGSRALGQTDLGEMQMHLVYVFTFDDHGAVLGQTQQGFSDGGFLCLQQFARPLEQFGARGIYMAFATKFLQRVDKTGFQAGGVIGGQAQGLCNAVGGLKSDAVNIAGQLIRVVLHNLKRFAAVLLVNLGGQVAAHAMAVQKQHHVAHGLLLLPGANDLLAALRADVGDFAQTLRKFIQYFEGLETEVVDDAFGIGFADAGHHAGTEVTAQTFHCGGSGLIQALYVELQSVLWMLDPLAAQ
jgi:hypothetical protein